MSNPQQCPCKGCTKRILYCHTTCPEYICWAEANEALKMERAKYEAVERALQDTSVKRSMNLRKRRRKN